MKKFVFVAFLIAMVALTQIQISPVLANEKEETPLYPVSGSDVTDQTFEIDGHLVADGFAIAISMDLPVKKMESTHTRVAFAVGLGDPWEEETFIPIWVWEKYTPYVKKMWLKVEGNGNYEPTRGAIVDNTGTGGSSTPDFLTVLEIILWLFEGYQIANFLMEVFQEPPSPEWVQELHSVKAIVRQAPAPTPRLQTASAWFDSYFKRNGWNSLTITAEAEIWADHEKLVQGIYYSIESIYVGTYQVSCEVRILVGTGVLVVLAKDQDGKWLTTGDVYVDDQWCGFTGLMFDVGKGTHEVFVNDFWESGATGYRYGFAHWEDGSTSPTRTVEVPEAVTAHFKKKYCPGDVNGDNIVDIYDVVFMNIHFGSTRSEPDWDSRADTVYDGEIDIFDVVQVSKHMGNEYPDP